MQMGENITMYILHVASPLSLHYMYCDELKECSDQYSVLIYS